MGLLSLLFALTVERSISAKFWQISFYINCIINVAKRIKLLKTPIDNIVVASGIVLLPTCIVLFLSHYLAHSMFELLLSSIVLLVCIGCQFTRKQYKCFLRSAFRGDLKTCNTEYYALIKSKNLPDLGLGQILIWLNFRYYIAIILMFVFLGPAGVVFYRLIVTLTEYTINENDNNDKVHAYEKVQKQLGYVLFLIEAVLVRLVSFSYMLVGNFSKALPTWLESLFDFTKQPYAILNDVAKQSEDFQLDEDDCTAEPCLLVRLAKRSLLLLLAIIAVLTITGIIH